MLVGGVPVDERLLRRLAEVVPPAVAPDWIWRCSTGRRSLASPLPSDERFSPPSKPRPRVSRTSEPPSSRIRPGGSPTGRSELGRPTSLRPRGSP